MTWSRHHSASEILAASAETAKKSGDHQRAIELYQSAAEAEEQALNATSPDKPRTLGVTAVSAASLYLEANLFEKSKRLAEQWRRNKNLPDFAVETLDQIIEIAGPQIPKNQPQKRAATTARSSFKASLETPVEDRQNDLSWEELFKNFYERLYSLAARLTHGRTELAEDLVQDTFVRVLRSSYQPTELKAPLGYLFGIMRNILIDQARKAKGFQFESLDDPNVELQERLPRLEPRIQRELENEEAVLAIRLKSAELSSREKLLLMLMADGNNSKDISAVLNEDIRIIRKDLNALKAKIRYRFKHSKNS